MLPDKILYYVEYMEQWNIEYFYCKHEQFEIVHFFK